MVRLNRVLTLFNELKKHIVTGTNKVQKYKLYKKRKKKSLEVTLPAHPTPTGPTPKKGEKENLNYTSRVNTKMKNTQGNFTKENDTS